MASSICSQLAPKFNRRFTVMKLIALSIVFSSLLFVPVTTVMGRTPPANSQSKSATITLVGTLKKVAVEGGCYQFAANDGKNYELLGKFPKQDGVKIKVTGTVATDVMTLCQVGPAFKVNSIEVIKNKR